MEPVTHFLTGACLGRSGFNRKTAYATLAMTLAAEAPDLDVFWGFRGPVAGFEHHRGITHTFLGAPFVALAATGVCWLIHRFRRKKPGLAPRWWLVWLFALIADLSHLLLDFTNNYGLRPFYPFNPRWYSWDIVFIFEPLMFGVLLLALVIPAILGLADREIGARKTQFRGRGWALAALVFVALLYAYRNAEHEQAMNVVRNYDFGNAGANPQIQRIALEPFPITPYRWFAIVETPNYFRTALIDLRRGEVTSDTQDIVYKPPVTMATLAAKRSYLGQIYLDWAKFPVVEEVGRQQAPGRDLPPPPPGATTVEFRDLRFAYSALFLNNSKNTPLSAWAYIGPQHEVEGMFMSGSKQK